MQTQQNKEENQDDPPDHRHAQSQSQLQLQSQASQASTALALPPSTLQSPPAAPSFTPLLDTREECTLKTALAFVVLRRRAKFRKRGISVSSPLFANAQLSNAMHCDDVSAAGGGDGGIGGIGGDEDRQDKDAKSLQNENGGKISKFTPRQNGTQPNVHVQLERGSRATMCSTDTSESKDGNEDTCNSSRTGKSTDIDITGRTSTSSSFMPFLNGLLSKLSPSNEHQYQHQHLQRDGNDINNTKYNEYHEKKLEEQCDHIGTMIRVAISTAIPLYQSAFTSTNHCSSSHVHGHDPSSSSTPSSSSSSSSSSSTSSNRTKMPSLIYDYQSASLGAPSSSSLSSSSKFPSLSAYAVLDGLASHISSHLSSLLCLPPTATPPSPFRDRNRGELNRNENTRNDTNENHDNNDNVGEKAKQDSVVDISNDNDTKTCSNNSNQSKHSNDFNASKDSKDSNATTPAPTSGEGRILQILIRCLFRPLLHHSTHRHFQTDTSFQRVPFLLATCTFIHRMVVQSSSSCNPANSNRNKIKNGNGTAITERDVISRAITRCLCLLLTRLYRGQQGKHYPKRHNDQYFHYYYNLLDFEHSTSPHTAVQDENNFDPQDQHTDSIVNLIDVLAVNSIHLLESVIALRLQRSFAIQRQNHPPTPPTRYQISRAGTSAIPHHQRHRYRYYSHHGLTSFSSRYQPYPFQHNYPKERQRQHHREYCMGVIAGEVITEMNQYFGGVSNASGREEEKEDNLVVPVAMQDMAHFYTIDRLRLQKQQQHKNETHGFSDTIGIGIAGRNKTRTNVSRWRGTVSAETNVLDRTLRGNTKSYLSKRTKASRYSGNTSTFNDQDNDRDDYDDNIYASSLGLGGSSAQSQESIDTIAMESFPGHTNSRRPNLKLGLDCGAKIMMRLCLYDIIQKLSLYHLKCHQDDNRI